MMGSIAKCKCGKVKKFRGNRKHFTCPDCLAKGRELVEVVCAGCGLVKRVAAKGVKPCDGYTCGEGVCKLDPSFAPPEPPEGMICFIVPRAAGSFSGWRARVPTAREREVIDRYHAEREDEEMRSLNRRVLASRESRN